MQRWWLILSGHSEYTYGSCRVESLGDTASDSTLYIKNTLATDSSILTVWFAAPYHVLHLDGKNQGCLFWFCSHSKMVGSILPSCSITNMAAGWLVWDYKSILHALRSPNRCRTNIPRICSISHTSLAWLQTHGSQMNTIIWCKTPTWEKHVYCNKIWITC